MWRRRHFATKLFACVLIAATHLAACQREPWQVGLRHSTLGHRFCGASVVNSRFVLTAASCLRSPDGQVLEAHNIRVDLKDDRFEELRAALPKYGDVVEGREGAEVDEEELRRSRERAYKGVHVEDIVVHPEYDPDSGRSDLALLRTKEFNLVKGEVWPVCFPDDDPPQSYVGRHASQRGWGVQSVLLGPHPSLLPRSNLLVVDNSECDDEDVDGETWMCARNEFFLFEECSADPGGSLTTRVFNVDVQDVLIGVVPASSALRTCPVTSSPPSTPTTSHSPARYTAVAGRHYDWLLDVTRGTTHCVPSRVFKNHYKRKLVSANRLGQE